MKYYFSVNKDVKIFVEDINPDCKKTILFVHGWPLNHHMFEYIINNFALKGYRCISVDLRGYGKSDKPTYGYDFDQMAKDIKHIIHALKLTNITLMGHSMGGAICTKYISNYDNNSVSKLCLLSAAVPKWVKSSVWPYGYNIEEVNKIIHNFKNDRAKSIKDLSENFFYKFTSQSILDWFFNMCLDAALWSTLESLSYLRDEELFNDLENIKIPTLILHGIHDKICPFEFAKYMNNNIENSFLVPLKDGGHGAFFECKDDINKSLEYFIENE